MYKRFFCFGVALLFSVLSLNAMQQEAAPVWECTLAIIKPDAFKERCSILSMILKNSFTIKESQTVTLTRDQAEFFYGIHKSKPFFKDLVSMMITGPVFILALEKVGAIQAWRDLMGDTDPAKAAAGTIRKLFGKSKGSNAVHGSDAPATAANELAFFFPDL